MSGGNGSGGVFGPVPNRAYHETFMRKAIDMAEMALATDETPVGCVFVHEGQVIGRGINGTNASLNVRFFYLLSYPVLHACCKRTTTRHTTKRSSFGKAADPIPG